jgi:hypothetical protein
VQLVHHQLADQPGRNLALAERAELVADVRHRGVDRIARHWALLERLEHSGAELRFVERLAVRVALDHPRHDELGGFEGREALAAVQTFAPAANLQPLA